MLKTGILNPAINSLLARTRHTNTLVIADRGFPFWPEIETIDISLVDDIPKVLDVLRAVRRNFVAGRIYMAREFHGVNDAATRESYVIACEGLQVIEEPHIDLKQRVPFAVGLIRTGDTTQYGNLIVESA
jgi:D-ribose pyranase